ncbi:hypothetical protein P3X46_030053 [Hevea brasiliensis]|uniref:Short-chain dehydrogenase TIC 32, chloroplastic-like n=1 Tax=Hevea brasiliensis TaxID=3981 RepID=A0ABQ9KU77_HEVBR|nr:hypothetical protein P3X46_030053 [Hevea brasiliensis]
MWIFGWKGASGFSACSTAEQVSQGIDGTGLTAIVTGASSGIGVETARVLALRGVHVIMAVRNLEAGKNVKETILKEIPTAKIDVMHLDLSSITSVRKFASEYISLGLPLNLLINNAGIMASFTLSQDNIEIQFATNHVGHFLLTNLLLETMKNTARESNQEGRIVNHRQLKEDGVNITANSLHPGAIDTKLLRHYGIVNGFLSLIGKYLIKNVQQGAATTCYVALSPQVKGLTGKYFMDSNLAKPNSQAKDAELAKKLWDFSLKLTNPK